MRYCLEPPKLENHPEMNSNILAFFGFHDRFREHDSNYTGCFTTKCSKHPTSLAMKACYTHGPVLGLKIELSFLLTSNLIGWLPHHLEKHWKRAGFFFQIVHHAFWTSPQSLYQLSPGMSGSFQTAQWSFIDLDPSLLPHPFVKEKKPSFRRVGVTPSMVGDS